MEKDDRIKTAIDRGYAFCEEQQQLLDRGRISEEQWFSNHERHFSSHYLATDNPRAQSGHGGDEARYRYTQSMIRSAIDKSGTFIDAGCANGYLIEKLAEWLRPSEIRLEFYGLDISAGLIELARRRLPAWKDRFFTGNALYWKPQSKFDFVCVRELGYVPAARRREFFLHLFGEYVAEGGRLILGPATERRGEAGLLEECASWGFVPAGATEKDHQEMSELVRRLYWFDKGTRASSRTIV